MPTETSNLWQKVFKFYHIFMDPVVPVLAEYSVAQVVGVGGSVPRRPKSQLLLNQHDTEIEGDTWYSNKGSK